MSTSSASQTQPASQVPFFGPAAQALSDRLNARGREISERLKKIQSEVTSGDVLDAHALAEETMQLATESEIAEKLRQGLALLTQVDAVARDVVRPAIKVAAEAAKPLSADVADIARIIFTSGMDIVENLEPERTRHYGITARGRKGKFDAYVKAGFTKQQAFAMVLAEIKPVDPASLVNKTSSASDKTSSASDKAKKKSG